MNISSDTFYNTLTPSFVNTGMSRVLEKDTRKKIKFWLYGHTHTQKTKIVNGITYMNNSWGYPGENLKRGLQQIEVKV